MNKNPSIPRNIFYSLCFFLLIFEIAILCLPKINLVTADLGRHIKNGEVILKEGKVFSTNFYSYVQLDFPVINHHWGSGVIFYWLWKAIGFKGLALFYSGLLVVAFLMYFYLSCRLTNFPFAFLFSVLSIPLLVSRTEIRPEGFSSLFLGIYLLIFYSYRQGWMKSWWLFVLIPLQILWVNCHVFFCLGPIVVFVFGLDAWIRKDRKLKDYLIVLGILSLFCLVNPYGLEGALAPLFIFKNYGYMLAENQSVLFMQKRFPQNLLYPHFELLFGVCVLGIAAVVRRNNWREYFLPLMLFAFFSLLAWRAIRGLALFGFMAIPFGALFYYSWIKQSEPWIKRVSKIVLIIALSIIFFGLIGKKNHYSAYQELSISYFIKDARNARFWIWPFLKNFNQWPGMITGNNRSAEFVKAFDIQGPIFNNYDIGGFLIFNFYPKEKVFVDNRPEAYDAAFFNELYVPMQKDDVVWERINERYQFNMIYFYRHDFTQWAQPFLIRRLQDPEWAPVFADMLTLIFVRRNETNREIIERFELPASMFSIQKN
jgi:hypothetical protein